jgi:hypothetical protein
MRRTPAAQQRDLAGPITKVIDPTDGQPLGDTSRQGGIGKLPKYLLLSKKNAAVQHARQDQTIMLLARFISTGGGELCSDYVPIKILR